MGIGPLQEDFGEYADDLASLLKFPNCEIGGLGGTPPRAIIEPKRDEGGEHFRNSTHPVIKNFHRFETVLREKDIFQHDPRLNHPVHRFLEPGEIDRCDAIARWSGEQSKLPSAGEGRRGHVFTFRAKLHRIVLDLSAKPLIKSTTSPEN